MYGSPTLNRQYEAAKRALALVNKLKPGPFRAAQASRVFRNLNRLRVAV